MTERLEADLGNARPVVDVAVGVLIDEAGRFLLTSRPAGKVFAGYWEFPGGKIEIGEDAPAALARELHEELGIAVECARAWTIEREDYPHARVRLHVCKVTRWAGELQMREGQSFRWEVLPVQVSPVLSGTIPLLRRLARERGWGGAIQAG